MNILVYRYNSICEPDVIRSFRALGLEVREETAEMHNKKLTPGEQVQILSNDIEECRPVFVFSINFFPSIAEVCHIYRLPYVCWTVDSPVLELFSTALTRDTNRIFMFDSAQYEYYSPYNPDCIKHLPLAAAVERFDETPGGDLSKDISFVGSLYSEKNPMNRLTRPLPGFEKGYIDGVVAASLKVYGANCIEGCVTENVIKAIKESSDSFFKLDRTVTDPDTYVVANNYIGIQATEQERILTLNTLARFFNVDLYTRSDASALKGVNVHGGIDTLVEMPQVFRSSRINLNMTSKSIRTGIPLRVFDICGCGGFVMTNYQADLSECFDIGVELEAYCSLEELVDKCQYYLTHEEERARIARNGYARVCREHRYIHRLKQMITSI